ncbi:MAG TPA: metallophosphoesterase family protein [Thermoleophilia bacterium]|nr:metallophosphoesterase family protein [Thermoleophilia bacterium]
MISDTHGRFDPALREIFAGVARIVHAGDVGAADVLVELATIAPVTAVRGNVDLYLGAEQLPGEATLEIAGRRVLVAHVLTDLLRRRRPAREGFDLVVTGHSHRYRETREDGVLFLNPGAAGAARFGLPRSVAIVELDAEGITVAKVELT